MLCEVCVDSVQSATEAFNGGAERIELCANLFEGGTTPSAGMIYKVRNTFPNKILHVIIRPRGGDFCYSDEELDVMKYDIELCKSYNVDGVVLGLLSPDGSVDVNKTKQLTELSYPMSVTFHRAIDMSKDIIQSLKDIMTIKGIQRVLTSGGESTCLEGLETLSKLVDVANDKIIIMPGGGITIKNIQRIINGCNAKEFHISGRSIIDSKMEFRNTSCFMGGALRNSEYNYQIVDSSKVKATINSINLQ